MKNLLSKGLLFIIYYFMVNSLYAQSSKDVCINELIKNGELRKTLKIQNTFDFATKAQTLVWEDFYKIKLDNECYFNQDVLTITTETGKKFTLIKQYEFCLLKGRTSQGLILDEHLNVIVQSVNDTYYCIQ